MGESPLDPLREEPLRSFVVDTLFDRLKAMVRDGGPGDSAEWLRFADRLAAVRRALGMSGESGLLMTAAWRGDEEFRDE